MTSAPFADEGLEVVTKWVREQADPNPTQLFGEAIRQSIDEVLDGPRTGRWDFAQLEKTEKTYVGTKIEIVIRAAFGLERGPHLDLEIEGHDVDLKWAMNSQWQIPQEAIGQLCLCIGGLHGMTDFRVGVVRCTEKVLNAGSNRDGKRTLTAAAKLAMSVLVPPSPIPPNFVAEMAPDKRSEVVEQPTIQARVTRLFKLFPYTPVPRSALQTVARTGGDPVRRIRADTGKGDPLDGMVVLSSQSGGNAVVEALGYPPLPTGMFMAVPRAHIKALPDDTKRRLPALARERFGLN